MNKLTKQAAARRLRKLATVAKLVKYDRAMQKLAGMPPLAAQQMNMASPGYKRAGQPAATMSPGKALMMGGALGYVPGQILKKRLKPQVKPVAPQPAQSPGAMNNKAGGYKRALDLQSMWGVKQPQESYWKQAPKGAAPPAAKAPDGTAFVGGAPKALPRKLKRVPTK